MTGDVTVRIALEVALGIEPATPDTPEMAEKRRRLQAQQDEIVRKGGVVDIPSEVP